MKPFDTLPSFIREALPGEECAGAEPAPPRFSVATAASGRNFSSDEHSSDEHLSDSLSSEAERSLLALEESLSDVIELEARYLRIPDSTLTCAPVRFERFVLEPPHRYAPFFARAAVLFDLSEDAVIGELARLRQPAQWLDSGVDGVSWLSIQAGPALQSGQASLVRIEPGVRCPGPIAAAAERVLVLEGRYEDSSQVIHAPGELHECKSGAAASFKRAIGSPCILASVAFGSPDDAVPWRGARK